VIARTKTIHTSLKELEDSSWFPSILRNFQTEFIGFIVSHFGVYNPLIRYLQALALPDMEQVDLCSGSGQPAIHIFEATRCFQQLSLTDKFPNQYHGTNKKIIYKAVKTDVLRMTFESGKCYTMFNAFHHFSADEKLFIVQKIQGAGSHFIFAEILEPRFFCASKVIFISTAGQLLFSPFIKPFSLKRLFFTYIIPLNLITVTLDGVISVIKSGKPCYYTALFKQMECIKIKRMQGLLSPVIIIHSLPLK
jgi:hypothetical protein